MLLSLAAVVSSPASEKPITVPLAGHQICKDATQTSGPCTVKVHGCSGIYKFKLKYEATATDQTSGKVGGSLGDHYDSASGAGGHAVYDLFNNKLTSTLTTDDCSCQGQTLPVGKCVFKGSICAMFNTSDDVAAGALSYKAFAWDLNQTNCSGSVVKYDKPEVAGEAAAKAVLAKCPQLALTCANVTGEALALPPRSAWQLA